MNLSKDTIVNLVLSHKFPLAMKHDVVAWFDPSRNFLTKSKTGSYKSKSGVYIKENFVPRSPEGFIDACNIVIRAWIDCKMVSSLAEDGSPILNSRGTLLNKNCSKRTDATIIGNLFNYYFKVLFKNEIIKYLKENKGKEHETKSTK